MAAYRRVYDSRHLQADCQEPGSVPEPYARQSSMGYLFTLKLVSDTPLGLLTCSPNLNVFFHEERAGRKSTYASCLRMLLTFWPLYFALIDCSETRTVSARLVLNTYSNADGGGVSEGVVMKSLHFTGVNVYKIFN